MKTLLVLALLVLATSLEAGGDALVRVGLHRSDLAGRSVFMFTGAVVLFSYGTTLNLAPLDWGPLIGSYVATFFVVAQGINLLFFKTAPSLQVLVGGAFILVGGAIVTLWRPV
jgi:hypothetical protein